MLIPKIIISTCSSNNDLYWVCIQYIFKKFPKVIFTYYERSNACSGYDEITGIKSTVKSIRTLSQASSVHWNLEVEYSFVNMYWSQDTLILVLRSWSRSQGHTLKVNGNRKT